MDAQKANFEITRMARLLGVTRQGYYAWCKHRESGPGPRARRREVVDQAVREAFHASDDVYGAPRITRELAAKGVVVDRKTVAESMRRQGLEGISPSMFTPVTTIQDPRSDGFRRSCPAAVGSGASRCGLDQRHHLPAHRRGMALPRGGL